MTVKFLDSCGTAFAVGIMVIMLMSGGCGGKKIYKPPENATNTKIVLINQIYEPGFYVELDEQDAGFLREKLEIMVAPGKHELKIFNTETAVAENPKTIYHKFSLKVEVNEQEVKEISLNWDDPDYSHETKRESIKLGEKKKEKGKEGHHGVSLPGGM